jgi:hypothetical protein
MPQFSPPKFLQSLYDLVPRICRKVNAQGGQEFSKTFDPPSLADGVGTTTTITATGVDPGAGHYAHPSFSLSTQGILLYAWVSAVNELSVRFQNETGGTIDLASGTLKVKVTTE